MKSISVVNIMLGKGRGGIEQAVLDYHEALTAQGYATHIIIDKNAAVKPLLEANNLPFSCISNRGAWDIVAIIRLKYLLRRLSADVGIAHGNRALSLLKHAAGACKRIAVMHNYSIKCANADIVFCPTDDLMRHVKAQGFPENALYKIPNMVRLEHGYSIRARQGPLVIGGLGRFVAKKGFSVFIQALALLRDRGLDFHAVLGGTGEEEGRLKALASEKELNGLLSFTGWVSDTKAFFEKLDIFCLPSLEEPFGIVLLEAMAQALPIVATDTKGPAEIIQSGLNGLLVANNDPAALADGLERLIHEEAQAKEFGHTARRTVREQYDMAIVGQLMDKALRQATC